MREAGWVWKDLTHLACVVGPGGFTSLRVGVSCINALSWSLKIPSAGIHLSDLYAARVPTNSFLWLHSTKRTELFVRGFGSFSREWPQPTHITLDNFLSQLSCPSSHLPLTLTLSPSFAKASAGRRGEREFQSPVPRSEVPVPYAGELLPEHRAAMEGIGGQSLPLRPLSDILPPFLSSLAYQPQVLQPWYGRGW